MLRNITELVMFVLFCLACGLLAGLVVVHAHAGMYSVLVLDILMNSILCWFSFKNRHKFFKIAKVKNEKDRMQDNF
jgi:hypothetical protein